MRNRINITLSLFIIFTFVVVMSTDIFAEENISSEVDTNNNLRLGNDYIDIVVNQEENALGRFAIETTGGAPFRDNDDNKPLVYGRPRPWTSYTSIWLDNDIYVFGGETGRRAGRNGKYGEIIDKPYVKDNSIITSTKYGEDLVVEQELTIVKSSTTGLYDSVQIKYHVENTSQEEKKVGMRIVLDTMLGENDGAPFRIGPDAVTTDKLYYKKQLPQFWQAFDSISDPNVTSQGAFTGPGITPPDQVKLADWGSLADGLWDFDFNPGEEFLRKGEHVIDSAIAMYWIPEKLEPGERRSYITKYGLGGITIVPGLLSLGITSPAEVVLDSPNKQIPVVAYVENTSEITAENVRISIELPDSLHVDKTEKTIGDLSSGDISQVAWYVTPDSNIAPRAEYTVKVEADNTDSNQVKREIIFVGPPDLDTSINMIEELTVKEGKLTPNPFTINVELKNTGGSTMYDILPEIQLPPGLILASGEDSKKYVGYDLESGEKLDIKWKVKALNVDGKLPLAVDIEALHDFHQTKKLDDLVLPPRKPVVFFKAENMENIKKGDYISVDIRAENIHELDMLEANIRYQASSLKLIHVSRGNIFMKDAKKLPWNQPDINNGVISLRQLVPAETEGGTVATLHFKVLNKENGTLQWTDNYKFEGNTGEINIDLEDFDLFKGGNQE